METAQSTPGRLPFRHVAAVSLGNALAFYDFLAYAFFAVQIGHTFFPDKSTGLLLTYLSFGAGFLMRPLGAFVIGRIADRIGRRPAMMLSFIMIGVAIIGVALTPPFRAIGWAAPILVVCFRMLLGFGVGGEVGPSTAYMLEAAAPGQRGFYTSLQAMTQDIASFLSGLVGFILASFLSDSALEAWGWRAALLLGATVVPLGLYLRRSLPETLHAPKDELELASTPRAAIAVAALGFIILGTGSMVSYVQTSLTGYAQDSLHFTTQIAFAAGALNGLFTFIFDPVSGWLSDRIGRRPVIIIGLVLTVLATAPAFMAILYFRSALALCLATSLLGAITGIAQPPVSTAIAEAMPRELRSRGLGLVYAFAISIFGGFTPYTVTLLTRVTNNPLSPAWYMAAAAAVGLAAITALRETAPLVVARRRAAAA